MRKSLPSRADGIFSCRNIWVSICASKSISKRLQYRFFRLAHACCTKVSRKLHARISDWETINMRSRRKRNQFISRAILYSLFVFHKFFAQLGIFFAISGCKLLEMDSFSLELKSRRRNLKQLLHHVRLDLSKQSRITPIDCICCNCPSCLKRADCRRNRTEIHKNSPIVEKSCVGTSDSTMCGNPEGSGNEA